MVCVVKFVVFFIAALEKNMTYELYGVTNHMGTLFAGHYTACVKHYASQEWFSCNDLR